MNKPITFLLASTLLSVIACQAWAETPTQPAGAKNPAQLRSEEFLRKYNDPEARKQMREQALATVRKSFEGFDKRLSLDAVTFEKFVQLSADLDIEQRAAFLSCWSSSDLACDGPGRVRKYYEHEEQSVTALLGADGYAAMRKWIRGEQVRLWVKNLDKRMPVDLKLTDTQADALIEAYLAEQKAVIQEYDAIGRLAAPYLNSDRMEVLYESWEPTLDARMASARRYSQRIYGRAATVLSGEQLTVFKRMQDELLDDLEAYQRNPTFPKHEGQPVIEDSVAAPSSAPVNVSARPAVPTPALVQARAHLEGFDKKRNLDPATFEKLVRLTAEQMLEQRALQSRCPAAARGCKTSVEYRAMLDRNRRDVTALLGERGYSESQQWMHEQDERRVVSSLDRRMPANLHLTDNETARLVEALGSAQMAVYGDADTNHQSHMPYVNGDGMQAMYDSQANSVVEGMVSARRHSQDMRERASTVLNGEQLAIFNHMQDKVLDDLQVYLRSDDSRRAGQLNAAAGDEPPGPLPGSREWTEELYRYYVEPEGEGRKKIRREELAFVRRTLVGFDRHRNLDAATFEKLVQLLADQAVDTKTMNTSCNPVIAPACDPSTYSQQMRARHAQAVAALIGAGGYEAAQNWTFSGDERRMVGSLARRMPANLPLTDSQSAALVDALQAEQSAVFDEAAATSGAPYPYYNEDGMEVMYNYKLTSTEDRMAEARSYSQRMRGRAATVLSGAQLAIFNQMQDRCLSDLQRDLRSHEVAKREGS